MITDIMIERARAMRKEGVTMQAIADELGLSVSSVYNMTRDGIDRRYKISPKLRDTILSLRKQGLTIEQIARRLDCCSTWSIWHICNEAGLNNVRLSQK